MYYERRAAIILGITIVSFLIAIVLTEPIRFGLCSPEAFFTCQASLEYTGQPIGIMSVAIAIVALVLLFCRSEILTVWLKYVVVWLLPVPAIWIAFTPVTCQAPLGLCVDKEFATFISASGFVIISLLVIGYSAVRSKRSSLG